MDNKKIIIIGIILVIIAAGVLLVMLTSAKYEKIEITPNGTSIEVPFNQTKFNGDFEGAKIWNWDKGILLTSNNYEKNNFIEITKLSFNTINELIKKGEKQEIDGFTVYTINADELLEVHIFEVVKVNYNGKFHCILLSNETTHDNIIICCKDKDTAVHMAKSVQYKNVYPNNNNLNSNNSIVKNVTDELTSKAENYTNNTNLSNIKSDIKDKAGDLLSKNPVK